MGAQPKDACSKPMTFSLPVPLRTTDIRIYPDQWSGAPLLHVNFLTCRLEGNILYIYFFFIKIESSVKKIRKRFTQKTQVKKKSHLQAFIWGY